MMKLIFSVCLFLTTCVAMAQVAQDSEGRNADYVKTINARVHKFTDPMSITDTNVINIIVNRYFELNDIYETRDKELADAKAVIKDKTALSEAQKAANDRKDAALYRSHFAYFGKLSYYLTDEQISAVKDGMTFGVLDVTYTATLEMIPSLKEDEKKQIYVWLVEARELAVDAESSKKKHEVFGKYKGRMNNYLAQRGYNLTQERDAWMKRIEAKKKGK